MSKLQVLPDHPLSMGAGAIYPYSDELMAEMARKSRYDGDYSMARVIGQGDKRRIMVPRNMAPGVGAMDIRSDGLTINVKSKFKPRNDEQARVIKETVERLHYGMSFMMEAPTGFGKTWCAMDIIAKVGLKTIIVVTKEDIRDQWIAAAEALLGLSVGKGIGLIQGDTFQVAGQSIVIAMIQSLSKDGRYPEHAFKDFGLAIWDECHRVAADNFSQSAYRIPAKLRLGISATPDRKDGKEEVLYAHIGRIRVRTEATPMTPRIIRQESPWECPMRRKRNADGTVDLVPIDHSAGAATHVIKLLANHHARNILIAKFVAAAYKKGRKILVQSDLKDHLDLLVPLISKHGVPMAEIAFYVGGMKQGEREVAKTKAVIMATYQMTAEATDIPTLDTLVMATPKSDVRQIVGRVIRLLEGKKEPVVFDITDSSSPIFHGYAKARLKWYKSIGASVGGITPKQVA